jgi:hypothetical protein
LALHIEILVLGYIGASLKRGGSEEEEEEQEQEQEQEEKDNSALNNSIPSNTTRIVAALNNTYVIAVYEHLGLYWVENCL